MEISTRILGPEHPDTLSSMINLALCLQDMVSNCRTAARTLMRVQKQGQASLSFSRVAHLVCPKPGQHGMVSLLSEGPVELSLFLWSPMLSFATASQS